MRRITCWLMSTVAAVVLLFSYRTSTIGGATATTTAGDTTVTPQTSTTPTPSATQSSGSASSGNKTYTGSVAQTQWGPIQVTITVSDGKITDVAVPVYPNGNHRDEEINAFALPALKQEVLAAQSAKIDTVSGATVTSDGYVESLQSAIDAAHLS
ncbi:FMN-binding protein [Spirillospora sp. CA-128828]|uniref:FMN-binding protein n=1 Tax=Spirillospora sp. CA-128828 TaxID=3240033 RepID=UPI003D8C2DBE